MQHSDLISNHYEVQVNLCKKLLFLYQLTNNIELQVQYMKIPSSNLGRTCCVQKLFLTFRCSPHVLQKEELLTKIYLYRDTLHGGSDAAAIAQINAVMAHVQTFFNLKVK